MAPSLRQVKNQRRIGNRGVEIMLDGNDGDFLFFVDRFENAIDFLLASRVHPRGRLVQNEKVRLAQKGPRDQQLLPCPPDRFPVRDEERPESPTFRKTSPIALFCLILRSFR